MVFRGDYHVHIAPGGDAAAARAVAAVGLVALAAARSQADADANAPGLVGGVAVHRLA